MFAIPTAIAGVYVANKAADGVIDCAETAAHYFDQAKYVVEDKIHEQARTSYQKKHAEIQKHRSEILEKYPELKRRQTERTEQQLLEQQLLERPKTVSPFSSVREFMTRGRKA